MTAARIACASPSCTNHVPPGCIKHGNPVGLCAGCERVWRDYGIALGGFVPVSTIDAIRTRVLDHVGPTKGEIAEALLYARGTMYPKGAWKDRPAYSKPRLNHGRAKVRLPHLLMCRRYAPSLEALTRAFTHFEVMSLTRPTGPDYNRWLAGVTFQPQTGAYFVTGRWDEIRKGQEKSPLHNFRPGDYSVLGTHALRSCERMGLRRGDHEIRQVIAEAYHELVLEGDLHGYVEVPLHARRFKMNSKHPLRHRYGPKAKVARHMIGKTRDQDGLIDGVWPVGIGLETKAKPIVIEKKPPPPAPDTGWLWS